MLQDAPSQTVPTQSDPVQSVPENSPLVEANVAYQQALADEELLDFEIEELASRLALSSSTPYAPCSCSCNSNACAW